MIRGARVEVKQELQKAIRCRRVAQGLDELPNLESRRPASNQVRISTKQKKQQQYFAFTKRDVDLSAFKIVY